MRYSKLDMSIHQTQHLLKAEILYKMTSAGLSYRKEDLIMSNANPGFGAGGASSYNIFLYMV
jgi:hypothetical protein